MVTTDCGRKAMQMRERFQENVPRELGRDILKAVMAVKHMLQSFILSAQALEDMISVSPVMGNMGMLIAVSPDSGHGTSNGGIILWNSIEGTSLPSVSPISGSRLAPSLDAPSVQDGLDRTTRNMSSSMRPQLETTGNIPFLTSHARLISVQETALRNGIDVCTTSLETMLLPQNARTTLTTGISLDGITNTPFYRASLPSSRRGTDGGSTAECSCLRRKYAVEGIRNFYAL